MPEHVREAQQGNTTQGPARLVTIVIPVFNEEGNVRRAFETVRAVFDRLGDRYRFEIVFTDNHSTDATFSILAEMAAVDARVRVFRFARNYGHQRSVLTGYRLARGDAAIQLDCDLQDPPELIPEMLERWQQGYDVVVGVRRSRQEGRLITALRRTFYRMMAWLAEDRLVLDGGDFRLIDRTILNQMRGIHDTHPYVRGIVSTLAARQIGIPYDRAAREVGESKFPWWRLTGLALDGILAHSIVPLRIASFVGLALAALLGALSLYYVAARIFGSTDRPDGFTTIAFLLAFGTAVNAIFFGIIGEYVGRIYVQLRQRPTTVIEQYVDRADATANGAAPDERSKQATSVDA